MPSVLSDLWSDCTCEFLACGKCICLHFLILQRYFSNTRKPFFCSKPSLFFFREIDPLQGVSYFTTLAIQNEVLNKKTKLNKKKGKRLSEEDDVQKGPKKPETVKHVKGKTRNMWRSFRRALMETQ